MSPIDLARLTQAFAVNFAYDRSVLVGQVQIRVTYDDTSLNRLTIRRVQLCSVNYVWMY